jgi:2-keto-4-pentenoate hydratase/2-oxohepta-3-ene-1,7-dioic acid hydratase in catechol pathway
MRVVSFEHGGSRSFGLLDQTHVIDVGSQLKSRFNDLRAVLAANALPELLTASEKVPSYSINEINFLPVIPNPEKILCVGLNYISHRTETKRPESKYPSIFTRFADTQLRSTTRANSPL